MKNLVGFLLLSTVFAFAGDNKHDHGVHHGEKQSAACQLKEGVSCTKIDVPTARCGMCTETIEGALGEVDGVKMAKFDLEDKKAHVHFTEKSGVEELEKAIAAAGYDANDTRRDEKAHAALPACCQLKR